MSAVKAALIRLNESIERLEYSVQQKVEEASVGQQREMFSPSNENGHSASKSNGHAQVGVDPAILAGRLDDAIGKVEKILKGA